MQFAGVRPPPVSHRIRGRKRDGEEVGLGTRTQTERPNAGPGEVERQFVHIREPDDQIPCEHRIGGEPMREARLLTPRFGGGVVKLGIDADPLEQIPGSARIPSRDPLLGVEGADPRGQRVGVPRACREASGRLGVPENGVRSTTDGEDRAAILAGDGEDARLRFGRGHPIRERRPLEPERRGSIPLGVNQRRCRGVHAGIVARDPGRIREPTGQDRCVPRGRLRDAVIVCRPDKERALVDEPSKAPAKLIIPSFEIIGPQLVDGQDHDQRGPGVGAPLLRGKPWRAEAPDGDGEEGDCRGRTKGADHRTLASEGEPRGHRCTMS